MDFVAIIALVGSMASIISITLNIVQYTISVQRRRALRHYIQTMYNVFTQIARAASNARSGSRDHEANPPSQSLAYVEKLHGMADVARTSLISYGREHLKFVPFYEHPLYPGVKMPDEVLHGTHPRDCKTLKTEPGQRAQPDK